MENVENHLESGKFDEKLYPMEQKVEMEKSSLIFNYDDQDRKEFDFDAHLNGNGGGSGDDYDDDKSFENR